MTDMDDEQGAAVSNRAEELSDGTDDTEQPVKAEKPRGKCTGCQFSYQLGIARTGEHKGKRVVRKHNSRTGPGLCSGAQQPPKSEDRHLYVDHSGVEWQHPGPVGECDAPECCEELEGANISQHGEDLTAAYSPQEDPTCEQCEDDPDYCSSAPHEDVVGVAPGGTPIVADPWTAPTSVAAVAEALGVQDYASPAVAAIQRGEDPFTAEQKETMAVVAGVFGNTAPLPFTAPAPASDIPESTTTVSGQPDPDRDQYGRYRIHGQAHTRATTFAKLGANTKAIEAWNERNVIRGLTLRPDLLMLANGMEVKRDRNDLNSIASQAKDAAGSKVAANIGTAYHAFTERLDAGLMTFPEVPVLYQPRVHQYLETVSRAGLMTRPEWIERTTAVRADQVGAPLPVAGTLDRIFQLPDGSLVIGDLKGLALTERIPTPVGWTTMDAVSVGDVVFDAYGKPCSVTAKSDVKRIGTYIVRFDDGSSVVCDTEHIWWTATGTRPGDPVARPIGDVIETLRNPANGQTHHRVPVAGALDLPEAQLSVDPYLLGCWLGDGSARSGQITKGRDLFEILEADGHALGVEQTCHSDKCFTRSVSGLTTGLRSLGLLHNKVIPDAYLRSSVAQRQQLLRGLMDTDGTWNTARKTAVFYSTDKALALQVEELLLSLGQRPYLAEVPTHGFGKDVIAYHVAFTPVDLQPFRLARKADQAAASTKPTTRSRRRVIVAVDEGPDVDTACIAVDSPTRTYLCGDRMIPTHNTGSDLSYGEMEIEVQLALYAHGVNTHGLFDWNTKTWHSVQGGPGLKVRTDIAIVVHLPADGDGCTLYVADIERGWRDAQRLGPLQASLKEKNRFRTLMLADLHGPLPEVDKYFANSAPAPAPVGRDETSRVMALMHPVPAPVNDASAVWESAKQRFSMAKDQAEIASLYQTAMDYGFHVDQLAVLVGLGKDRLNDLALGLTNTR